MSHIQNGKLNIKELLKQTGKCNVSEINKPNYKIMAKAFLNLRNSSI